MATNEQEIRGKIQKLREYWIDDEMSLKFVSSVEKNLRNLLVKEKLVDSQAIRSIVEDAQKRISVIDVLLKSDDKMTELERQLLFREKKVYDFFINRLEARDLDQQFDRVGQMLDEELRSTGLME